MITECYSFTRECPCFNCEKNCCIETEINGMTDTEKLCDKAKEYCEARALKCAKQEYIKIPIADFNNLCKSATSFEELKELLLLQKTIQEDKNNDE